MNAELVPTENGLPSLTKADEVIAALIGEGDKATLHEVAQRASVGQIYENRRKLIDRANHYGRLKVLAEAAIASLDLEDHPKPGDGPLVIDGREIDRTIRNRWRLLAIGLAQGQLSDAIDEVAADGRSVSTRSVYDGLRSRGVGWVDTTPLRQRFEELRAQGWTYNDVADKAGVARSAAKGAVKDHGRTRFVLAKACADAMGVPAEALRPKNPPKRSRYKSYRRRQPEWKMLSGGRWDKSYSALRKAIQEFAAVAGEDQKWDDTYARFYELEETIGRAVKREAQS